MDAKEVTCRPEGVVIVETRRKTPRESYIKKEDAEEHGYTKGCGGCTSWFKGLARQLHTERCRERVRELLKENARVKHAKASKREFEQKELDKKRKKEERNEVKKTEKQKREDERE